MAKEQQESTYPRRNLYKEQEEEREKQIEVWTKFNDMIYNDISV